MSMGLDIVKNVVVFFVSAVIIILILIAIVFYGKDIIINALKEGVKNAINKIVSI